MMLTVILSALFSIICIVYFFMFKAHEPMFTIHEHIYADGEHRFQDVEYKKLGVENIFGSAY